MKFWTLEETRAWLDANDLFHGADAWTSGPVFEEGWHFIRQIDLPPYSREQAELSRSLIDHIRPFHGCVLSMEDRVSPDDEDLVLMDRFRLSYGETRPVSGSPTFVFDTAEYAEAVGLLRLFLTFCWDGWLLSSDLDYFVELYGHEGFGRIYTKAQPSFPPPPGQEPD
jgi:hypothetical protein